MAYVSPPLEIDEAFVEKVTAQAGPPPEARFRFASPCIEGRCAQWDGAACRIARSVVAHAHEPATPEPLPDCGIRPSCRWFSQEGRDACLVCPKVIRTPRAGC